MVYRRYLSHFEVASQVWLHPMILALVVLILKIFLFTKSITAAVSLNSSYSVDLCNTLNEYNNYAAGVPGQLSQVYNKMLYQYLLNYHSLVLKFISLIITIIKNLVEFYIEVHLGTYTCLLEALVKGTLNFVADAIETITNALNQSVNSIISELQLGLSSLSSIVNGIINSVNTMIDFFSDDSLSSSSVDQSISLVNLTISKLEHLNISSSSITTSLDNLQQKIPDFGNLTSETIDMLASPLVRFLSDLNLTTFIKASELPSAKLITPTLCSPTSIDQFYVKLCKNVSTLSNYLIVALSLTTLLLLLSILFKEYKSLSKQSTFLQFLHKYCQVDFNETQFRNYLQTYFYSILFHLNKITENDQLHWLVTYTTNSYAITPFLLGIWGLICTSLQFALLSRIKSQIKNIDTSSILTASKYLNASLVQSGNDLIISKQTSLNRQLTEGITSVTGNFSESINDLLFTMNDTIITVFSHTPFEAPISTIVYCTIGRKLSKLENGLNWISNNFNITIPQIPESEIMDVFDTKVMAISGDVGKSMKSGLSKVVSAYSSSVWWELYLLVMFVGIWVLYVIAGGCKILVAGLQLEEEGKRIATGDVGDPKPLTYNEKKKYGYPFLNPFDKIKTYDGSSSVYS